MNNTLWDYFLGLTEKDKYMTKWTHYFAIYERHFSRFRDRPIRLLEIGVLGGGSLKMWKHYFHKDSIIVGIDIDSRCVNHQDIDSNIHIRIGSQSDSNFIQSVVSEFQYFDIIIDDGGHTHPEVYNTFTYLYQHVSSDGVYLIEDANTSYFATHNGNLHNPNTIMNRSKDWIDKLHKKYCDEIGKDVVSETTYSITYYDSVIILEKISNLFIKSLCIGDNNTLIGLEDGYIPNHQVLGYRS